MHAPFAYNYRTISDAKAGESRQPRPERHTSPAEAKCGRRPPAPYLRFLKETEKNIDKGWLTACIGGTPRAFIDLAQILLDQNITSRF